MRLNLSGLEPRVLAGQGDVVHALVLDAGELVEHVVVEVPQHLEGKEGRKEGRRRSAADRALRAATVWKQRNAAQRMGRQEKSAPQKLYNRTRNKQREG